MAGVLRRFALEKPVIFWSFVIGSIGPVMVWTVPTIRREYFGYKGIPALPLTYPLPNGPRNPPAGYED
ncbi:hypothetical protein BX666DRAFT_1964768 [Dichotomocladium elegans]|nr:hypothetical protein BX666DRAFT_1964768 [Dichotomocladium elegans]